MIDLVELARKAAIVRGMHERHRAAIEVEFESCVALLTAIDDCRDVGTLMTIRGHLDAFDWPGDRMRRLDTLRRAVEEAIVSSPDWTDERGLAAAMEYANEVDE